ncbi:MAG: cbb3-type cytochrome c oxidase subunit I [Opitutaceae bacterium]
MSQNSNQAPLSADADPVHGLGAVDRSVRFPVLILMGLSLLWLLTATVLSVMASFKLHTPGFLADHEWLTYGRVRPAATTAMIYGWATNAAFALAVWLMARLSRARLLHGGLVIVGAVFWNLGVDLGIAGILLGKGLPYEWMALPGYSGPLLLVAYILMAIWVVNTFRYRQDRHVYVSQWFLLAALFSFPWVFSVAQIMLVQMPVRGTMQALVGAWYAQNLIGLWLMPVGLASAYYFIPKVLGKPIHSYYLAVVGFWSLIFAVCWSGPARLVGGPIPAWVISAGIVGCVLLLIPVVVTTVNLHLTTLGSFRQVWNSPTLRFVVLGSVAFTLVAFLWAITSFRTVAEVTHFTLVEEALNQLAVYGFFSMTAFGGFYFIVPRLLEKEWPSASLVSLHFWSVVLGFLILMVGLFLGGVLQGLWMNDPVLFPEWVTIVHSLVPYLLTGTVGWILILLGHLTFLISFIWMLISPRSNEVTEPTLFASSAALKSSAS